MDDRELQHGLHGGDQLGRLVARDSVETMVIRNLGLDTAQSRVDLAFANARLEAAREALKALADLQSALMQSPDMEKVELPMGLVLFPAEGLGTLRAILG